MGALKITASRGQAATRTSRGGNPEPCCEQMFQNHRHAGYIALMRELRLQHAWQLGDWYWNESTGQPNLVGRRDDGSYVPFRDPAWLPPLTHWLDQLREAGVISIEFTRDSDDPPVCIIRAWDSGPWRVTAEGRGPTDEEAAARCWAAVRRK
jgi:hypothetical protein